MSWKCQSFWTGVLVFSCLLGIQPVLASPTPASPTGTSPTTSPTVTSPTGDRKVLELSLSDAIQLVLQQNRDIKNANLDRLVQRLDLWEAEGKFQPKITPRLSVGVDQQLSSSPEFSLTSSNNAPTNLTNASGSTGINPTLVSTVSNVGGSVGNGQSGDDRTRWNRAAQVTGTLLTPIGTQISLTVDAITDPTLSLSVTQPLLRGAGLKANQASVNIARVGDRRNALALQQLLIDKVTETIVAYRAVIKARESLRIQGIAIASKRRQLEVTQALVQVGRKPKADLIDAEKTVADSDRTLLVEQNNLAQAVSNLLRLLEADQALQLVIPQREIDALVSAELPQMNRSPAELLQLAYQQRIDYLQSQLDLETEQLNGRIVQNNQLWNLDLKSETRLGSQSSTSGTVVVTHTFGDRNRDAELPKHQIRLQKANNRLVQVRDTIQQELSDRLRDLTSNLSQVTAAQRTREFAEQQFRIAQERFKSRGSQTTIFELIQKQDDLILAQNNELTAKIDYLNAIANLEKTLGITLETWQRRSP
ncbi:MAG: TolC family protein [Synechococcales bacterium]|nr:TolC family protein [Synechococcales bacterium]